MSKTSATPKKEGQTTIALKALTPDDHNANKGTPRGTGMLEESLRKFGAGRSILADKHLRIIAGNKTLEGAAAIGLEGALVVQSDGTRLVVVQRTDLDLDDPVARELALADNRVGEVNLEWDAEALQALHASGSDLSAYFREDELLEILSQDIGETEGHTDPDDVPEERATDIKLGDLFELGKHRLLCGDSTKAEDVARVMGQDRAGLMNTDPPYGIGFDNSALGPTRTKRRAIANDGKKDDALQAFLELAFKAAAAHALKIDAAWYLWHADLTQGVFAAAAAAAKVVLHRQIIWSKPRLILGRGQYHWKHEPCFMGWVEGNQAPDYGRGNGERDQTTVWEVAGITQSERDELNHATPKPVGLFAIPIIKHLRAGEVCYEPFAGSGPQVIAAEQCGVSCRAIELHPPFVQTIIDRWEAFSGSKAVKVG